MYKGILTLLLLLGCCTAVLAQRGGKDNQKLMEKANAYYRQYNFPKAINAYQQLEKKGSRTAVRKLADSYRLMNDLENAEIWYRQAVEQPNISDKYYFYFAQALMGNGKYEEAAIWFRKYQESVPENRLAEMMIQACEQALHPTEVTPDVAILNLPLNTEASEFGPSFFQDGILFTSSRIESILRKKDGWTNSGYLDMYYTPVSWNDTLPREERIRGSINTFNYHDGPGCATADGERIYFTRNNVVAGSATASRSGEVKLKIFSAVKTGDTYKNVEELEFNGNEYSCAYPSVTADGKRLYFSSDKGGGMGGTDIYYSDFDDRRLRWSQPVNAGPQVNTEGDERFPFIHEDGTLYFASNGHLGIGGLDIFQARGDSTAEGGFCCVENLGKPYNSEKDDFSYIIDPGKTTGYFASNRGGGAGSDDIYQFTRATVPLSVKVMAADSTMLSCHFTLLPEYGKTELASGKTNIQRGDFRTRLLPESAYTLVITGPGYRVLRVKIQTGAAFVPVALTKTLLDPEVREALPEK